MAAAFGLPVVVIFGTSDPAIWGPWRTAAEVVTAPAGIARCGDGAGPGSAGAAWGARMKQVARLLSYGRRYWPHLSASVVLMAVAGAAQAAMLLLIKQVFDRRAGAAARRPGRFLSCRSRFFGHQIYLDQIVPLQHRGILVIVAVAIVGGLPH